MSLKAFAATLGLASLVLTPAAMADQWNKKTYITINESIQVPGRFWLRVVCDEAGGISSRTVILFRSTTSVRISFRRPVWRSELSPATNGKDRVPMVGNSGRTA